MSLHDDARSFALLRDIIDRAWSFEVMNLVDRSGPGGGPGVPAVAIYIRKMDSTVLHCREGDIGTAVETIHQLAVAHDEAKEKNA